MNTRKHSRRARNMARIIAIVAAALIVLAATVVITIHFVSAGIQQAASQNVSAQHAQLAIDPNAGDRVYATPAPTEPGVAVPGWSRMTVPAGVTEVSTSLPNPEANEGRYYLTYELRLKDTGEVLFTTGLIPPGKYCNSVTFSRPLEPGEYPAIIHVQPYRISDQSPTNNADLETVLVVK